MCVLNLGSLNVDRVFRVPRIVQPGETIASRASSVFAGGKGANQSVALARAGARVAHVGKIGPDGRWLLDKLAGEGIDTRWVRVGEGPSGQAIIQVDDAGQNAIVLLAGANEQITAEEVDEALSGAAADAWLLVQNETSAVGHAIRRAKASGRRVAFNPAPFDARVFEYPIESVDLLCVNESEAAAMVGEAARGQDPEKTIAALAARLPDCEILLTLGAAGALHALAGRLLRADACRVEAIDTTAAGDVFLGYFLAGRLRGQAASEALGVACRAAALCVTRPGAMDSIPFLAEVSAFPAASTIVVLR